METKTELLDLFLVTSFLVIFLITRVDSFFARTRSRVERRVGTTVVSALIIYLFTLTLFESGGFITPSSAGLGLGFPLLDFVVWVLVSIIGHVFLALKQKVDQRFETSYILFFVALVYVYLKLGILF